MNGAPDRLPQWAQNQRDIAAKWQTPCCAGAR
jgi:hypothetical protein